MSGRRGSIFFESVDTVLYGKLWIITSKPIVVVSMILGIFSLGFLIGSLIVIISH